MLVRARQDAAPTVNGDACGARQISIALLIQSLDPRLRRMLLHARQDAAPTVYGGACGARQISIAHLIQSLDPRLRGMLVHARQDAAPTVNGDACGARCRAYGVCWCVRGKADFYRAPYSVA